MHNNERVIIYQYHEDSGHHPRASTNTPSFLWAVGVCEVHSVRLESPPGSVNTFSKQAGGSAWLSLSPADQYSNQTEWEKLP